jgi:hypothetical protein
MTSAATEKQERLRDFVRFSAAATGFSEFDLWGTGQAEAYYQTVLAQEGPDALLEAIGSSPTAPITDPVVKSIIKLWYMGVWYGTGLVGRMDVAAWTAPGRSGAKPAVPDDSQPVEDQLWRSVPRQRRTGEESASGKDDRMPPFVVSPTAYTEGLLWQAIGAHPAGAKAPGYGSWAEPPVFED